MTTNSDFVEVQLSAAGVAFAGKSGTVRIANGHFSYKFSAATPVRVLTSEWSRTLSKESWNGQPILQLAPAAPAAAVAAAPATVSAAPATAASTAPAASAAAPAAANTQAPLKTQQPQQATPQSEIAQEGKK